jgi:hypothetical protein
VPPKKIQTHWYGLSRADGHGATYKYSQRNVFPFRSTQNVSSFLPRLLSSVTEKERTSLFFSPLLLPLFQKRKRKGKERKRGAFSLFLIVFTSSMPRHISCLGATPPCKGIRLAVDGAHLEHSHFHPRSSLPHGSYARPLRLI